MSDEMYPRIVEEAPKGPSQCLFSQDQDGPWIDTGLTAPWIKPHGYLGVRYVEFLARELLGMIPRREVMEQVAAMQAELDAYGEQIAELENFVDRFAQAEDFADSVTSYQETREGAGIA